MQANEQTDEQVAQYCSLYSCWFQTTVHRSFLTTVRAADFRVLITVPQAGVSVRFEVTYAGFRVLTTAYDFVVRVRTTLGIAVRNTP